MLYFHQGKLIPVTKQEAEDSYYRPLLEMPDDVEVVLKSNGCQPNFYKDNFKKYYYEGKWHDETRNVFPIGNPSYTKVVWTKDMIMSQIASKGEELSNTRQAIQELEKHLANVTKEYDDLVRTYYLQKGYFNVK